MILQHLESLKEEYAALDAPDMLDMSVIQHSRDVTAENLPADDSQTSAQTWSESAIAQNTRRVAQRRPVGYGPPSRRPAPCHDLSTDAVPSPFVGSTSSTPRDATDGILTEASGQHLRTSINNAWSKLEKYYNRTDRSRAYFGSVRMHPALNEAWFPQHWKDNDQLKWLDAAEDSLRKHYDEHYRSSNKDVDMRAVVMIIKNMLTNDLKPFLNSLSTHMV
jgi:hypothetical protein